MLCVPASVIGLLSNVDTLNLQPLGGAGALSAGSYRGSGQGV